MEGISSDVEVRVANPQSIYGTPEIIFEVEDCGCVYSGTILLQSELGVWRGPFSAVPVDCNVKTVADCSVCVLFVMSVDQGTSQNQPFSNY